MKVLQVIHGYPPLYSAGSEIYTQALSQALADNNEVHVFTRQENQFRTEYSQWVEQDPQDSRVTLHYVNTARGRDRYRHAEVDHLFGALLDSLRPDVVHIGHLNHLSTSLVLEAKSRGIPTVFTLHDYWLMCPRTSSSRTVLTARWRFGPLVSARTTGYVQSGATRATSPVTPNGPKARSPTGHSGSMGEWTTPVISASSLTCS